MKEINLTKKLFWITVFAILTVIGFILYFNVVLLLGELSYRKVLVEKPKILYDKKNFYRKQISSIKKAAFYQSDNAEYYSKQADIFLEALNDGFLDLVPKGKGTIHALYSKAISLNPVNSLYYLKSGWLYEGNNNDRALAYLKKTIELSPFTYQGYFYLSKFFFRQKEDKQGFKNLFNSFYLSSPHTSIKREILAGLTSEEISAGKLLVEKHPYVYSLAYLYDFNEYIFNFAKEGFLDLKINRSDKQNTLYSSVKLRVYLKEEVDEVSFYYNREKIKDFIKVRDLAANDTIGPYSVYESSMFFESQDVWLKNLQIKALPLSIIDKIEFYCQP